MVRQVVAEAVAERCSRAYQRQRRRVTAATTKAPTGAATVISAARTPATASPVPATVAMDRALRSNYLKASATYFSLYSDSETVTNLKYQIQIAIEFTRFKIQARGYRGELGVEEKYTDVLEGSRRSNRAREVESMEGRRSSRRKNRGGDRRFSVLRRPSRAAADAFVLHGSGNWLFVRPERPPVGGGVVAGTGVATGKEVVAGAGVTIG